MGQAMGNAVAPLAKQPFVLQLLKECAELSDNSANLASWTNSVLTQLSQ